MARSPNPAWGLYLLIAGYLFCYGSAQTASSGFDGGHPYPPQRSLSSLQQALLQI